MLNENNAVFVRIMCCNLMLQLLGIALVCVGAWIRLDKTAELRSLLREVIDPAVLIMMAGSLVFLVAFLGCIGALRENLTILAWVRMLRVVKGHEYMCTSSVFGNLFYGVRLIYTVMH